MKFLNLMCLLIFLASMGITTAKAQTCSSSKEKYISKYQVCVPAYCSGCDKSNGPYSLSKDGEECFYKTDKASFNFTCKSSTSNLKSSFRKAVSKVGPKCKSEKEQYIEKYKLCVPAYCSGCDKSNGPYSTTSKQNQCYFKTDKQSFIFTCK